jgi:hypothetical protein
MKSFHWRHCKGYVSGTVTASNVLDAYRVILRLYGLGMGEVEVK